MDIGHYETELILRETEADVARVYRQATEEMQKKLEDYLRKFKIKDQIKRDQLKAGEITKAEYDYWRTGQIAIGKRWTEMKNTLARDLHNTNNIARSIVQGHMPDVYAVNHNYATFQVEKESLVDTSYTLYDRQTVERIIRDQPNLLPPPGQSMKESIAAGKDIAWQRGHIQSVMTQSILQGESIPHIAQRIARTMGESNRKSTVRYARTAATGAQNAGRVDAYKRAEDMGIELEQEWLATLDMRTRNEHRQLDGMHVPVGEPFKVDGYEIRFPGDPEAPGHLIWNCRCTLVPKLKGLDQSDAPRKSKLGDMSYDDWKKEHEPTMPVSTPKVPVSTTSPVPVSKVSPDAFVPALDAAKASCPVDKAWRVDTTRTAEDFRNDRITTYVTKNGSTFALKDDGDIISVCKNQLTDSETNARSLMAAAVKAGGNHLDSFDGNYGFYVRCGFEPVSRCRFSEEFAPPGWVKGRDKEEDIYFMCYVGVGNVKLGTVEAARFAIPYSPGYDEAEAVIKNIIKGVK